MPTTNELESYDYLEKAMKAARVPTQLWEGIGNVWVDNPARAHHLVARFKDSGETPAEIGRRVGQQVAAKFKQVAPADAIDQAIARLTAAALERAKMDGDTPIAKAIDALTAQLAPPVQGRSTITDSGDQSVATKSRSDDVFATVLQGDLRTDMIPR